VRSGGCTLGNAVEIFWEDGDAVGDYDVGAAGEGDVCGLFVES